MTKPKVDKYNGVEVSIYANVYITDKNGKDYEHTFNLDVSEELYNKVDSLLENRYDLCD